MVSLRTAAVLLAGVGMVACGGSEAVGARSGGSGGADGGIDGSAAGGGGQAGLAGAAGGGAGGGAGTPACVVQTDCPAAATTPPGCSVASCVNAACRYEAVDADGDGHRAAVCSAPGVAITLGDDCDDDDDTVHPGAWDGPANLTTGDPDRCGDGVDQDCVEGDGNRVLPDGSSCLCAIGEEESCAATSAGTAIAFPSGVPLGACRFGTRRCVIDTADLRAMWGQCNGAVAPAAEVCDGVDGDCDGVGDADESPPPAAATWYLDVDGDGYAALGAPSLFGCFTDALGNIVNPGSLDANFSACPGGVGPCARNWTTSAPDSPATIDCNEGSSEVHPGGWRTQLVPQRFGIKLPEMWSAEYFVGTSPSGVPAHSAQRIGAIDFAWGEGSPTFPSPAVPRDLWSARFTGTLIVPDAGDYTFGVVSDDGVRLWVGPATGTPLLDCYTPAATCSQTATWRSAGAQEVPITLEYVEGGGNASVHLDWTGPGVVDNDAHVPVACGAQCIVGTQRSCPGALGECRFGTQSCLDDGTWGLCSAQAQADACDGLDNDCDGQVDEEQQVQWSRDGDRDGSCDLANQQWPACAGTGVLAAPDPRLGMVCPTTAYSPCRLDDSYKQVSGGCRSDTATDCNDSNSDAYPENAERCDGQDQNCNGVPDDGIAASATPCSVGLGACYREGTLVCSGGTYSACSVSPGRAQAEACNRADDDCDGKTDEDFAHEALALDYNVLGLYQAGCSSGSSPTLYCNSAAHRACPNLSPDRQCRATGVMTCGAGPWLHCFAEGYSWITSATLSQLAMTGITLDTTSVWSNLGKVAVNRFCRIFGHAAGVGPVELSGETATFVCLPPDVATVVSFSATSSCDWSSSGLCDCSPWTLLTPCPPSHTYGPVEWNGSTVDVICFHGAPT